MARLGLIKEVQNVGASLNKQERARRERERLKILQENYKKEIKDYLGAEFTALFNQYDMKTAEEMAIFRKDNIIEKLYNELYNRHYLQKSGGVRLVWLPSPPWDKKYKFEQEQKKVFLYRNFDILTDLNENYYKILKIIQKEAQTLEKLKNKRLLLKLKDKLGELMELNQNKYFLSIALKQNKNINAIIEEITTNESEKDLLFINYDRILNQILKLYHGDIIEEKSKIKAKKEVLKEKQKRKVTNWLIYNYILSDISKSLPKPHNKKKKY